MLFEELSDYNLEKLLEYVKEREGDPDLIIHSMKVPMILRADIASYENFKHRKQVFRSYLFRKDEEKYSEKYMFAMGGFQSKTFNYGKYLQDLGIDISFFDQTTCKLVFYEYLYKEKIPLPETLWYSPRHLTMPTEIYLINEENWEKIIPYPITKDQYMKIIFRDYATFSVNNENTRKPRVEYLSYASGEDIIDFIESYPSVKNTFDNFSKNIRVSKMFLVNLLTYYEPETRFVHEFFSKLYDYPGRKGKIANYLTNTAANTNIFAAGKNVLSDVLIFPPYWFEEKVLDGEIIISDKKTPENLIEMTYSEPNRFRPVSHEEMGRMIERKDPKLLHYTKKDIIISAGYNNITRYQDLTGNNFEIINKIKRRFGNFEFDLLGNPLKCSEIAGERNYTLLGEQYGSYAITFGDYFDFDCFDVTDLVTGFQPQIIRDEDGDDMKVFHFIRLDDVAGFSSPSYTTDQIKGLQKLLQDQDPAVIPGWNNESLPLISLIITAFNTNITLKDISRFLKGYISKDSEGKEENISNFLEAMKYLFFAGMIQREWDGPNTGEEYPYYVNSLGEKKISKQCVIDVRMAFYLSMAGEYLGKLTGNFATKISVSPAIYKYVDGDPRIYNQTISGILDLIVGDNCVGFLSSVLIETGYFYTKQAGKFLPPASPEFLPFNHQLFDWGSVHRG